MADRVTVVGIDQYSGGNRPVMAEASGAHILLACAGSEGGGESLLTPDQANFLAVRLRRLAESVCGQFDDEPESL